MNWFFNYKIDKCYVDGQLRGFIAYEREWFPKDHRSGLWEWHMISPTGTLVNDCQYYTTLKEAEEVVVMRRGEAYRKKQPKNKTVRWM